METLHFSLKVISPAFIGGGMFGYDNIGNKRIKHLLNHDDPLRIPSLRGVLRFWFRTLYGNLSSNLDSLKALEGKIFGDTTQGQGLRLIPLGHENLKYGGVTVSQASKIGYLGYGPLLYFKDNQNNVSFTSHHANPKGIRRDAVMPGAVFHFLANGNHDQIEGLKKCLILLHIFGGIGSRSRRGWGSLSVVHPADLMPKWENDVGKWINQSLGTLWENGRETLRTISNPTFSAFSQNTVIAISKDSWDANDEEAFRQVLQKLANTMLNIRSCKNYGSIGQKDHDDEVRDFNSKTFRHVPKRLVFGMPYVVRSRDKLMGIKYLIEYPGSIKNSNDDRRASPLLLKIIETPNEKLYAVALFLKAQFFGEPATQLNAQHRTQRKNPKLRQDEKWDDMTGTQQVTDWSAIKAFLNHKMWESKKLTFK